jgi:hypothetical protein
MDRENPMTRKNIDSKSLLNQENYIFKATRITAVETDEIKENIRLTITDDTEDHTKGVNGDKMDTNVTKHKKRDQESFNKVENNKHPSAEEEQNTVRKKLKEDLKIM